MFTLLSVPLVIAGILVYKKSFSRVPVVVDVATTPMLPSRYGEDDDGTINNVLVPKSRQTSKDSAGFGGGGRQKSAGGRQLSSGGTHMSTLPY